MPPPSFAVVEPGLYRCAAPGPTNFPYLAQLGLTTVVFLSAEALQKPFKTFLDTSGIQLAHLGLKMWQADGSWRPVNDDLVKEALEVVLDARSHPVLVCCSSGVHETGTVVACLRRLQQWCMTSTLDEVGWDGCSY